MTTLLLLALMQTTTTVTTDPQPPPPPASTQVVVQPGDTTVAPSAPTTSVTEVQTVPNGRSTASIVATDALYGGIAGGLVGGGITLIDQGNYWQRDLMVGAGIGILVGAAFGIYEAAMQPQPGTTIKRADADPAPGSSNTTSFAMTVGSARF